MEPTAQFFDERREQSQIKTEIVLNYFFAWTKILLKRTNKIAYVDLFAGPGQYEDGTRSTPLLVLDNAVQDLALRNALVTIFNDGQTDYIRSLEAASAALPGIKTLRYQPQFLNTEVGVDIANALKQKPLIPTFYFIDPWGYKGLSLQLVNAMLKDWGSECVLFFNYNRINPGLNNSAVRLCMNEIFGEERATELRTQLATLSPPEREQQIVHTMVEALRGQENRHVLPFQFKKEGVARTSHHLFFVTKHIRGYNIMKEIMAKKSSRYEQGVASFSYDPNIEQESLQLSLFPTPGPLDSLAKVLLQKFTGQKLSVIEIFRQHHVGTPYLLRNYKSTLRHLEEQGEIVIDPPANRRRKETLSDNALVQFPQQKKS